MHPVCVSRKYPWSMIRELNSVSQPHLLAGLCAGVAVNKKAPFLLQYSDPAQSLGTSLNTLGRKNTLEFERVYVDTGVSKCPNISFGF